jgi:hypothetical protein
VSKGILNHFPIRTGPGADEAGVELSQKLNEWLEHSGPSALFRTCQSCKQMKRENAPAFCDRWQMTPPVDIIMRGCDFHEDEAIAPF